MRSGKQTVGIVGLGIMGGAFARNLVASGFQVIGFDIDPARRRAARKAKVEIAADAAALAARAPVIITSLPHPAALVATVSAITAAKLPRRIVVEAKNRSVNVENKPPPTVEPGCETTTKSPAPSPLMVTRGVPVSLRTFFPRFLTRNTIRRLLFDPRGRSPRAPAPGKCTVT